MLVFRDVVGIYHQQFQATIPLMVGLTCEVFVWLFLGGFMNDRQDVGVILLAGKIGKSYFLIFAYLKLAQVARSFVPHRLVVQSDSYW